MELKHYRTPGSKNGIRLYQNEDGSLTPLGEKRYLKGEKNRSHYYDQGYKPGFFDLYGKQKQKELNAYKKQVGMKTYKGYEKAEAKVPKISDPKKWKFEFNKKLDYSKPAAIRKRREEWTKINKQLEDYDTEQASQRLLNKNKHISIGSISWENVRSGIHFLNILAARDYPSLVAEISAYRNQNNKDPFIPEEVQVLPKDIQTKGAKAWLDIALSRFLKK